MKEEVKMEARDSLRKMVNECGYSLTEVAEALGFASVSGITNKFAAADVKVGFMCKVAEVCGYELVLRSKDGDMRNIVVIGND